VSGNRGPGCPLGFGILHGTEVHEMGTDRSAADETACWASTSGQEMAAFTSPTTVFSTAGLHAMSAYETGHRSPSSRFAVSWNPRVEYR